MARLPAGLDYGSSNVTLVGYNPPPGPQQPGLYPTAVGPAYLRWGEQRQNGYLYNSYTDSYEPDPVKQREFYESSGLQAKPAEQPGALSGLGAQAGGAAATALGGAAVKAAIPWITGSGAAAGTAAGAGAAGAAGAGAAGAAGTAAGTGLVGVGTGAGLGAAGLGAGAAGTAAGTAGTAAGAGGLIGAAGAAPVAGTAAGAAGAGAGAAGAGAGTGALGGATLAGAASVGAGLAGAYGLYDVGTQHYGAGRSVGQGVVSGAALGTTILPGIGTAVGAVVGGLIGLFSSTAFQPQGGWKKEKKRLETLQKEGTYLPPGLIESMPQKARKPEELIRKDMPADFVGRDPNGNWVNNRFAKSRNVADLQGTDIVNYAKFAEHDPDWFHKPLEERIGIADQVLKAGAVKEHHGTIDISWDKVGTTAPTAPQNGQPATGGSVPGSNVNVAPPSKGTRLSPGVYADGRGGSTTRR